MRSSGFPALAPHHTVGEAVSCGGGRSGSQQATVPLTQPVELRGPVPGVSHMGSLQARGHFPQAQRGGEE